MPRIRTIKPEFYRHHDLFLAEKESNLPIRVAFSGLWCCADKEGRFKWRPTELKLDILPYDEINFEEVLECLIKHDFIVKYEVSGKLYGFIPTFTEHQRITGTEKNYESKLPAFNGNTLEIHSDYKEKTKVNHQKIQLTENQMAFQSVSLETSRQVGKDRRKGYIGKDIKERIEEVSIPENFLLLGIYDKNFEEVREVFPNTTKDGFLKWKKFVDFIYKNSLSEIFKHKVLNPGDFSKLDFPEELWDETIRAILGTGIKEEHNLFFRIPQFVKIVKNQKNKRDGSKKNNARVVSENYND